ncbi:MAG: phage protein Gp36 family protein, partial [Waterburya sp.]
MAYSTVAEFEEKFQDQETAELCSLDDDAELTAVRLRIQQSIEHADAEINAILGGRYNMPP